MFAEINLYILNWQMSINTENTILKVILQEKSLNQLKRVRNQSILYMCKLLLIFSSIY